MQGFVHYKKIVHIFSMRLQIFELNLYNCPVHIIKSYKMLFNNHKPGKANPWAKLYTA